jgi:hypothetical protein
MFDYAFFQRNQSVVHQAIQTLSRSGELYCVKIAVLKFVNKLCDCLMHNVEVGNLDKAESAEEMTVKMLLEHINRTGFISQIHQVLVQKDCPLLMLS